MKIYNQFLSTELLEELHNYAKVASYLKVQDGIYNYRRSKVPKNLYQKVERVLEQHNISNAIESLRIQCIDDSITVAENFHRHDSVYKNNLVCFLNDDFIGGEFEYTNPESIKIKPVPNTALVFEPELRHRVLPVIHGKRYTLVGFLLENSYFNKKEKTLI